MKKLILTFAVILGISLSVNAQYLGGGGLFERGDVTDEEFYGAGGLRDGMFDITPNLPKHDQPGNQDAPLGGGILVLAGLGAAYALSKRKEE